MAVVVETLPLFQFSPLTRDYLGKIFSFSNISSIFFWMGSNNKTYHNLSTQRCVLAKQTDPFIVTKQCTAARCFCLLWIITQLFNDCWVSLGAAHHCARIFQFFFGADVASGMISSCLISVNCAGLGRILTGGKPAHLHRCSPYQGSGEMNSQTFFTNLFWSPPCIHTRYSMQDGKFVCRQTVLTESEWVSLVYGMPTGMLLGSIGWKYVPFQATNDSRYWIRIQESIEKTKIFRSVRKPKIRDEIRMFPRLKTSGWLLDSPNSI